MAEENKASELYETDYATSSDPYAEEIRKAAHDKNYKVLLNSAVSRYNLQQQTNKLLNNQMQGMQSQGYGTTAHLGVQNQASNLYAQDLSNYQTAENEAEAAYQQALKTKADENEKTLGDLISGTNGSNEAIANYMKNAGYKFNEYSGQWENANGKTPSEYILNSIEYAKQNTESDDDLKIDSSNIYGVLGMSSTFYNSETIDSLTKALDKGYFKLNSQSGTTSFKDGSVIMVAGENGNTVYVRYDKKTNSYRRATKAEFDSQSDSYVATGGMWLTKEEFAKALKQQQ